MEKILNGNLDNFQKQNPSCRGWFMGSFVDKGSPLHSDGLEVKWSHHKLGDKKEEAQKSSYRTITVLISGKFSVSFPESSQVSILNQPGDFVYFGENILHNWESLEENSCMLTIRWLSVL